MYNNPTIWIELGSHTDSRSSDRYNLILSQRRANAAVEYIVAHGIAKTGLQPKVMVKRCC
jgi:outer membrane protein OmpA-like peptidoglycan-associated protein